jgi:hypothetical protein
VKAIPDKGDERGIDSVGCRPGSRDGELGSREHVARPKDVVEELAYAERTHLLREVLRAGRGEEYLTIPPAASDLESGLRVRHEGACKACLLIEGDELVRQDGERNHVEIPADGPIVVLDGKAEEGSVLVA